MHRYSWLLASESDELNGVNLSGDGRVRDGVNPLKGLCSY